MDEVDNEAFDMTSIVILICHYHDCSIPELFFVRVRSILLADLKTYNLYQILNLAILSYLGCCSIANIQQFAL